MIPGEALAPFYASKWAHLHVSGFSTCWNLNESKRERSWVFTCSNIYLNHFLLCSAKRGIWPHRLYIRNRQSATSIEGKDSVAAHQMWNVWAITVPTPEWRLSSEVTGEWWRARPHSWRLFPEANCVSRCGLTIDGASWPHTAEAMFTIHKCPCRRRCSH